MTLTPDQLQQLLDIVKAQMMVFAASTLGPQVLSTEEINLLTSTGIDVGELYRRSEDPVLLNFHLGLISQAIGQVNASHITFDQLKHYISSSQYIPLSERELATVRSIKSQALGDIRAHQGKIFQDINQVVTHHIGMSVRENQEEFIRHTIVSEFEKHKTIKQISVELAKRTGDWERNFYKSVQYICHTALNEGRLAMIERREGHSGLVYFQVQKDACKYCVGLYLTSGEGSKPKLFTIKELLSNGSNIGRKVNELKPTISPVHVGCRCLLTEYVSGEVWKEGRFKIPKDAVHTPVLDRKKVHIKFNGQDYYV